MKIKLPLESGEEPLSVVTVSILWNEMRVHDGRRTGPMPVILETGNPCVTIRRLRSFSGKEKLEFIQALVNLMKLLGLPANRDEEIPYLGIYKNSKEAVCQFSISILSAGSVAELVFMRIKVSAGMYFNIKSLDITGWSFEFDKRDSPCNGEDELIRKLSFSIVELLGKFGIPVEVEACLQEGGSSDT